MFWAGSEILTLMKREQHYVIPILLLFVEEHNFSSGRHKSSKGLEALDSTGRDTVAASGCAEWV